MQPTTVTTGQGIIRSGDTKTIMAYCHYLVMKAQLIGNLCFDGHKPTEEENQLVKQCRMMCGKLSRSLDLCKLNEIPYLLDYYDIIYRIGNRCLPDAAFIDRHKRRVFKAWKAGDREIDESSVYSIVAPEVSYHPEKADSDYFAAYRSLKEKWLSTLKNFNCFPEATSYENYQRLALIMRENLTHELGPGADRAKLLWYNHNKIDDLSAVGSFLLRSYRRFASALFPAVLDSETQLQLDNRILSELSARSDLNPYDREAFSLALAYNKQLAED